MCQTSRIARSFSSKRELSHVLPCSPIFYNYWYSHSIPITYSKVYAYFIYCLKYSIILRAFECTIASRIISHWISRYEIVWENQVCSSVFANNPRIHLAAQSGSRIFLLFVSYSRTHSYMGYLGCSNASNRGF